MRAGRRDKRVTIRQETATSDGAGGQTVTWADLSPKWWVSIDPLSARESLQAGAVQNAMTHIVRGLHRGDVSIKHRLYWPLRSLTFEIVAFRSVMSGTDREIELECVEVDS